jgi:vesicle-fusing ATPase
MEFKVTNLPNPKLAFTNRVYVSKEKFQELQRAASTSGDAVNITIEDKLVFMASGHDGLTGNELGMSSPQRKCGSFTLQQVVIATIFTEYVDAALNSLTIHTDLFVKKAGQKVTLDCAQLSESFKTQFSGQVFSTLQSVAMDFNGSKLDLMIDSLEHAAVGVEQNKGKSNRGQILQTTDIQWKKATGSQTNLTFTGGEVGARNDSLFKSDFDFNKMGIGGLDEQFKKMFRTAFASRMFPGLVKELGINHVRGILLYGPPGCGKTLIARQIGKILNAREPKIINGPEVLDKFVGGSEQKIRDLFADAEKEQAEMGDASMLHIIIFDEMDAIMKSRGSTRDSTGVNDSIVNQLLSKIDGVDSLNNILIIGMTNRKDMIDEAILRPGRLEIHIEITLPTTAGRLQILNIKTADMRKNNRIAQEVIDKLEDLAEQAKNYTGAELEGLVKSAASFALARNTDAAALKAVEGDTLRVEWNDFMRALTECVPAFGNKDGEKISSYYLNGVCSYGAAYEQMWGTLQRLLNQTRHSERTPLMSVLVEGAISTGKTALCAKLAAESNFPFIRMISPDSMIGYSESQRCGELLRVFTDSYKSSLSVIFIDDIERIIEFTPVGCRFSNSVLQTLLVLLRKVPPAPCRLLVISTTSIAHLLDDLQLTQAFNVQIHASMLQLPGEMQEVLKMYGGMSDSEILSISQAITKPIGVKQLLMVLEMARTDGTSSITPDHFLECLHTVGF